MNLLHPCILYTQDEDLIRRMQAYLRFLASVKHIDKPRVLERTLKQVGSTVLVYDLLGDEAMELLPQIRKVWPATVIVAVGQPQSDPARHAENLGVYAVIDEDAERKELQALVTRALDHAQLIQENEILREEASHMSMLERKVPPDHGDRPLARLPLQHFSRAARDFEDFDLLLANIADAVANSARVARVGIVSRKQDGSAFGLRAGVRCFEQIDEEEFHDDDPLVQWLDLHGHIIANSTLEYVKDRHDRLLLKQALNTFGAEIILPLQARGKLLGWMFLGHRVTGVPFDVADLEDLMVVAEHISVTLENALLYEETTVQKALAETLLDSMPSGMVAVDTEGDIRWFNKAAESILERSVDEVVRQPIDVLGTRVADPIHQALRGIQSKVTEQWFDQIVEKHLRVESHSLSYNKTQIGALVLIRDVTDDIIMKEKEERLERATFWAELAASMSHEVRNPLVAIKTFAQLLRERYEDPEFRSEFSNLVEDEVDRLDKMIDKINEFAHPAQIELHPLDIGRVVQKGINVALMKFPNNEIKFEISLPNHLPDVYGDEAALTECFAHLTSNAIEAVSGSPGPRISVSARSIASGTDAEAVEVTIKDNGRGIDPALKDKLFSPFSTTKARGMGLGMPIAERTVADHQGKMNVATEKQGTRVTVQFPVEERKEEHETHTRSG